MSRFRRRSRRAIKLGTPCGRTADAVSAFGLALPTCLVDQKMHLDPNFEHLTYGDRRAKGKQLSATLQRDDLLVFYAGLLQTNNP